MGLTNSTLLDDIQKKISFPKEIIELILLNIGCNETAYRTLSIFQKTNKYWYEFIDSEKFNKKYGELYGGNLLCFKKAIVMIKSMIYNYGKPQLTFHKRNCLRLYIELKKEYLIVYEKFNIAEDQVMENIEYNNGQIAHGLSEEHLAKIELTFLGPDSKRGWILKIDNGMGCFSRTGNAIFQTHELYLPLHYVLYNKIKMSKI
jgi:hypothetical protein